VLQAPRRVVCVLMQKLTFYLHHLCLQIKQEQANQQKHLQGKEGELSDAKKSLEPLQVLRPSVFPLCSAPCFNVV